MTNRLNRRRFIHRTSLLAAGAVGLGALRATPVQAIEPIARDDLAAKFKFSLAAYSYRRLLKGKRPKMTLLEFMRDCAAMGLEGTELTSYYFPPKLTTEYLLDVKQAAFRLGLTISGTAVANDFCNPDKRKRAADIAKVKQWVDHAATLGAPVIRIFSGRVYKGQTAREARNRCIEAIEACCEYSGRRGVYLALENHGGLSVPVDSLLSIVQAVKSPWFGVNLDTGNFHSATIYEDLAKAAPYAINVQVKAAVRGPDRKRVKSDYGRVAKILRVAGYRGFVVAEYEEKGDPRVECPKMIDAMRKAFGSERPL
ncbi:MAG: sugar phosphate isomerase/epimerase [Pirellulales bacterium]|nr:sugar phosphate isomerase/epimerase [Pirellulales bacterium]